MLLRIEQEVFRTDAKCEKNRVVLGGNHLMESGSPWILVHRRHPTCSRVVVKANMLQERETIDEKGERASAFDVM